MAIGMKQDFTWHIIYLIIDDKLTVTCAKKNVKMKMNFPNLVLYKR